MGKGKKKKGGKKGAGAPGKKGGKALREDKAAAVADATAAAPEVDELSPPATPSTGRSSGSSLLGGSDSGGDGDAAAADAQGGTAAAAGPTATAPGRGLRLRWPWSSRRAVVAAETSPTAEDEAPAPVLHEEDKRQLARAWISLDTPVDDALETVGETMDIRWSSHGIGGTRGFVRIAIEQKAAQDAGVAQGGGDHHHDHHHHHKHLPEGAIQHEETPAAKAAAAAAAAALLANPEGWHELDIISASTSNDGSFLWKIPPELGPRSGYHKMQGGGYRLTISSRWWVEALGKEILVDATSGTFEVARNVSEAAAIEEAREAAAAEAAAEAASAEELEREVSVSE